MKDVPHGTANGYTNYGCRCDECRVAHNEYYKKMAKGPCPGCGGTLSNRHRYKLCAACRDAATARSEHGTEGRYIGYHCRCDDCRRASAEARQRRRRAAAA